MTEHSQNRGSPIARALHGLSDEDKARVLERPVLEGRIGAQRDFTREQAASSMYERLRSLTRPQLERLAGRVGPRQVLIAEIIERDLDDLLSAAR